jgi:hypothetical protein
VNHVVLAPGSSLGGFTAHTARAQNTEESVTAAVAISLAGEAAEVRYGGDRKSARDSAGADYEYIAELIREVNYSTAKEARVMKTARIIVDCLLDHCWPAVRFIARRLMTSRRVEGSEIYRALWRIHRRPSDEIVHAVRVLAGR